MLKRLLPTALAALFCLLLTGARPDASADEEEIKVSWQHPYLENRFFDYSHREWGDVDTADLPAFYEASHSTYEYTADGDTLYTWEVVLDIREPEEMNPLIFLDWLSAHEDSEIVSFEGTFKSALRTDTLDASRLVEGGFDDGSRYVSEDRALALTVPLDRPGTLSFKVTTRSPAHDGLEAYFGGSLLVQKGYFIGARDISFVVPEGTPLRFETRFFGQKPLDVVADGKRTVTYRFRKLMPPRWDPGAPHSRDAFPSIFWSNQRSNADLGAILSGVWEPNLGASPAMVDFAAATVQGLETVQDKAVALHDAVADGWGYLGFYPGESGWIPHASEQCFDARLGDCKDQSALMIALMRSVGLTAWPVVVYAGTPLSPPKVPAILANHAVVWVEDPGEQAGGFLLDSTDTGTAAFPPSDWITGRKVFLVHPTEGRYLKIPRPGSSHRLQEDETTIDLQADGSARIHLVERWHGGAANRRSAARRSTPPAWWAQRQRERLAEKFPGATVTSMTEGEDVDDDNAFVLEAHLEAADALQIVGERGVLALPWPRGYRDDLWADGYRLHPRVQEGYEHRHRMRLHLPEGAELLSAPKPAQEVRDDWTYALTSEVVDRELRVDLAVSAKPGRVSSRMEEVRRNFFAALTEVQRRPVVLLLPEAK